MNENDHDNSELPNPNDCEEKNSTSNGPTSTTVTDGTENNNTSTMTTIMNVTMTESQPPAMARPSDAETAITDPMQWWRQQERELQLQQQHRDTITPVAGVPKAPFRPAPHPDVVQWGDWILLQFAEQSGRNPIFAQVVAPPSNHKGRTSASSNSTTTTTQSRVKINRRSYSTQPLVGIPYGTVLQVESKHFSILPPHETLEIPTPSPSTTTQSNDDGPHHDDQDDDNHHQKTEEENDEEEETAADTPAEPSKRDGAKSATDETTIATLEGTVTTTLKRDNRELVDSNTSQGLNQETLISWRQNPTMTGSTIVQELISNSKTFATKTKFSQEKYIRKKQYKYQIRCRVVKCNTATIAQAVYTTTPKKIDFLRPDTLAYMLTQANITPGHSVLVWEDVHGLITGAVAERMGGYGQVFSIYTGQQPSSHELYLQKYNFPFGILSSIQWVHAADVFTDKDKKDNNNHDSDTKDRGPAAGTDEVDLEAQERDKVAWPCVLQDHTREYLKTMETEQERVEFLQKRAHRFARKLTRPSPLESAQQLWQHQVDDDNSGDGEHGHGVDSLILAVRNVNVVETIEQLWPYLAPSAPFVIFSEHLEPLTECFAYLQQLEIMEDGGNETDPKDEDNRDGKDKKMNAAASNKKPPKSKCAIQLRLTAAWTREYQVLPERTHPAMNMTQNGGFLLTGTKLHDIHGRHELDPAVLAQIKATLPTRRGKKRQAPAAGGSSTPSSSSQPSTNTSGTTSNQNNNKNNKQNNNTTNHTSHSATNHNSSHAPSEHNPNESNNNTNQKIVCHDKTLLAINRFLKQTEQLTKELTTANCMPTNHPKMATTIKRKTPRKSQTPTKLPVSSTLSDLEEQEEREYDRQRQQKQRRRFNGSMDDYDETTSEERLDGDDYFDEYDDEDKFFSAKPPMVYSSTSLSSLQRQQKERKRQRRREICILYGEEKEALFFSKKRRKQAKPKHLPIAAGDGATTAVEPTNSDGTAVTTVKPPTRRGGGRRGGRNMMIVDNSSVVSDPSEDEIIMTM